jgi:hypothetical protein
MIGARHGDFATTLTNDSSDFFGVGRNDDTISRVRFHDALPDANNERRATK